MANFQNPAYASPSYIDSPITGDILKNLDANSVRQIWKRGFDMFETTGDFFNEMEGKGPLSLIQTETDTAKGAGQKITFSVASEMYAEPHLGDALFEDSRHFEELLIASNELQVDWFRHGIRHTQRTEEVMGMRGQIAEFLSEVQGMVPNKLGGWAGRLKTEQLFMMFVNMTNATVSPTGNTARNVVNLGTGQAGASYLTWDPIVLNAQAMKRWGATGATVAHDPKGKHVRSFVVVACTDALTSLEMDSDYRDILKTTRDAEGAKYIFSGGYTPIRGHVIKEYEAIEHDGYGPIGSPLNPMGRLGVGITLSSSTITGGVNMTQTLLTGGGSDYDANSILIKPVKYFPNYAYAFQEGSVLAVGSTAFYVAVCNPGTAAVDPNKWGFYKCTTNDGVNLTVSNALVDGSTVVAASAGAGTPAFATTLGNVTWNGSVNSTTHGVDSLFVLCDSYGRAIGNSLILSAGCARRGYGKYRGNRFVDSKEAGFIREVYFWSVFGQSLRTNRKGQLPGAMLLQHNIQYAGLPLPT